MSGGLLSLKWNNHSSAFEKLLSNLHLKVSLQFLICYFEFDTVLYTLSLALFKLGLGRLG